MQERDRSLDIAKGICIVLMVVGHSGCPEYLFNFIYSFHMPCFFFISGMLLCNKYLTDIKGGILKKLKGYYWPFIKWEMIFLLLHNVFVYFHIYKNCYTIPEIIMESIRVLTMSGGEQLLGGFWFLICLTWASIGSILFFGMLQKYNKLTDIYILSGVILSVIIASIEIYFPFYVPQQLDEKTFLALAFFMSGYLYRRLGMNRNNPMAHWYILCLMIPAIISFFIHLSMADAKMLSGFYFIVALSGSVGILQFARILGNGSIADVFNYIGKKTLYILIFHFISFKIVSYIWLICNREPIERMSEFPTQSGAPYWLWIIYCIVGVGVPLAIWEIRHKILSSKN